MPNTRTIIAFDENEAGKFLATLENELSSYTFQTWGNGSGRTLHGSLSDHAKELERLNSQGHGIGVTVNRTDGEGRKDAHITHLRTFVADFDGTPLPDQWPIEPSLLIESSPGKYHAYWLLSEPVPADETASQEWRAVQKAIASRLGSDSSITDLGRVLRLPGSVHTKSEPQPVKVVKDEGPRYAWANVVATFGTEELSPPQPQGLPEVISEYRNNTLTAEAGRMRSRGLGEVEIASILKGINEARCSPPLADFEVETIAQSVARYQPQEDITNRYYPMSDVGNARRFIDRVGERFRYVPEFRSWIAWDGGRWVTGADSEARYAMQFVAESIRQEASQASDASLEKKLMGFADTSSSRSKIRDAIATASDFPTMQVSGTRLDADPTLIGVRNGTLDLTKGEVREPRKDDYISRQLNVDFDPDASASRWMDFLATVTGGDQELMDYLQRWAGYLLTGYINEQAVLFLHGGGKNGKSTFLNVLFSLLGPYAAKFPTDAVTQTRDDKAAQYFAQAHGARTVIVQEIQADARLDEATVKDLSGGEAVSARRLYEANFSYIPTWKLVMYGNHKPAIKGSDEGIWRRLRLVPFTVEIPPKDRIRGLDETLKMEEGAGILAWAVRGCLEWQAKGLADPEVVTEATKEYRHDEDLVGQFLEETTVHGQGMEVSSSALYSAYRDWARSRGLKPMSQNAFSPKVKDKGFELRHTKGGRVFEGLGLWAKEVEDEAEVEF